MCEDPKMWQLQRMTRVVCAGFRRMGMIVPRVHTLNPEP